MQALTVCSSELWGPCLAQLMGWAKDLEAAGQPAIIQRYDGLDPLYFEGYDHVNIVQTEVTEKSTYCPDGQAHGDRLLPDYRRLMRDESGQYVRSLGLIIGPADEVNQYFDTLHIARKDGRFIKRAIISNKLIVTHQYDYGVQARANAEYLGIPCLESQTDYAIDRDPLTGEGALFVTLLGESNRCENWAAVVEALDLRRIGICEVYQSFTLDDGLFPALNRAGVLVARFMTGGSSPDWWKMGGSAGMTVGEVALTHQRADPDLPGGEIYGDCTLQLKEIVAMAERKASGMWFEPPKQAVAGKPITVEATLFDADTKLKLKDKTIRYWCAGVDVGTGTTGLEGYAPVTFESPVMPPTMSAIDATLRAVFPGDTFFGPSECFETLHVAAETPPVPPADTYTLQDAIADCDKVRDLQAQSATLLARIKTFIESHPNG